MEFIELRSFSSQAEAGTILAVLRQAGVNCHLHDGHIATADPVLHPALCQLRLMVHHLHAERAWSLIDGAERAFLRRVPCPVCKKHLLELICNLRRHECRMSALINMLLTGKPIEMNRQYRCRGCGYDFRELPN